MGSFMQSGAADGNQTMDVTLSRLVQGGLVRAGDALEKALDKDAFSKLPHVARELGTEP